MFMWQKLKKLWTFLWILLIMSSSAAEEEKWSDVHIEEINIDGISHYVVATKSGEYLHDPVTYEIDSGPYNDQGKTFYYYDNNGKQFGAVYVFHTETFSGFKYHEIRTPEDGMMIVYDWEGKAGAINENCEVVIPLQWVDLDDFEGGYSTAYYETDHGYESLIIDKHGNVIDIPQAEELALQSNGYRLVKLTQRRKTEYQAMNTYGNRYMDIYSYMSIFHTGTAIVEKEGKYGVVNLEGMTVIQEQYDGIEFMDGNVFCAWNEEGVSLIDRSDKLISFIPDAEVKAVLDDYIIYAKASGIGVIFSNGEPFLDPVWDSVDLFSCGIMMVQKDNQCFYLNKSGETIYSCMIGTRFQDNVAVTYSGVNQRLSVIDTQGHVLFSSDDLKALGSFVGGLCPAVDATTSKVGFIDKYGNWVIRPSYDDASEFFAGFARINDGGMEGLINEQGEVIMPCEWDGIQWSCNRCVSVKKDERWMILTMKRELISSTFWEDAGTFSNGYCKVKQNGLWGFIDEEGRLAIPCQYTNICGQFENGICEIIDKSGSRWLINTEGKVIAPQIKSMRPKY